MAVTTPMSIPPPPADASRDPDVTTATATSLVFADPMA